MYDITTNCALRGRVRRVVVERRVKLPLWRARHGPAFRRTDFLSTVLRPDRRKDGGAHAAADARSYKGPQAPADGGADLSALCGPDVLEPASFISWEPSRVDGVAAAPPRDTVHTNETRAQDRAHRNADVRALEDTNTETVAGAYLEALAGTFVYALGGPYFRAHARAFIRADRLADAWAFPCAELFPNRGPDLRADDLPHVRAVDVADAEAVAGSHLEALAAAVVRSLG